MLQSNVERKELESKTVDELRKICKERGISYYSGGKRLIKSLMIDKLLDSTVEINKKENNEDIKKSDNKDDKKDKQIKRPVEADDKEVALLEAERLIRKREYIEQATIGTIVAFKLPNEKVISAVIIKKSTKGRKFMVETKYGAQFKISFDDVLWVRTNKRWPKGIYLLFKQNNKVEVFKDGKEIS